MCIQSITGQSVSAAVVADSRAGGGREDEDAPDFRLHRASFSNDHPVLSLTLERIVRSGDSSGNQQ